VSVPTSTRSAGATWRRALTASGVLLILASGLLSADPGRAVAGASRAGRAQAAAAGGFHKTETISRVNLIDGKNAVVDTRTVKLRVGSTTGLRDRQEIDVSWSGAHPTGGIIPDDNSGYGVQEEYPMVLLECRGIDSTKVAPSKQLTPETCYTQTPAERYDYSYGDPFPPWRLDRYATAAGREATIDQPDPLPSQCGPVSIQPEVAHWLPFEAVNGKRYYGGSLGCAGLAPEQSDLDNPDYPANATYADTAPDGSGSANFVVQTNESNASLGCSQTVPCALVAIPIMGTSCDPAAAGLPASDQPTAAQEPAAQAECTETGAYAPGASDLNAYGDEDVTVAGELWWSPSNWRNRITVPLTFAPPANVCQAVSSSQVDVYGSELMDEAAIQWQPHFCLSKKLFNWNLVTSSEPEAVTLLSTGVVSGAFATYPPATGFTTPTVQAPVAVSGFAIAYDADTPGERPLPVLRLDARLLAKLLTESYPGDGFMEKDDPGLAHNPLDIAEDPEFEALNPGASKVAASEAASTLVQLATTSDVITALTSYINADPEARAWLNGKPDPWGMTVNPAYKGIKLPVNRWPLLDTTEPEALLQGSSNPCYNSNPSPWLSLIADPAEELYSIALDMQYAIAQPETICNQPLPGSTAGETLGPQGRQDPGHQFMLGLVSLADAKEYQLPTAELETSNTGPTSTFTPKGRTFVGPTQAALRTAADTLKMDKKAGTWTMPYGKGSRPTAYPGTMLVNLDAPTRGLPKGTAADLGELLTYAAGPGQIAGAQLGQLPAGYLPLTKANGLGAEAAYTVRAAQALTDQTGKVPSLTPPPPTKPPAGKSGSPSPSGRTSTSPTPVTTTPASGATPGGGPTARATATPTPRPTTEVSATPQASVATPGQPTGVAGLVLPALAGLGVVALVSAGISSRRARRSGR
jgi:hypothetical protein